MSLDTPITRDVARNIADKLREMLGRELHLASKVVDAHQLVFLTLQIASSLSGASVMLALQFRRDGTDPDKMFDVFSGAIATLVADSKRDYLATLSQVEAQRARAGAP